MPTHYKGTEREQRALNAWIALSRAMDSMWDRVHRHLSDFDLTPGQLAVLEALLHLGPLRQNVLAEKVLRTKGNMTLVVDNLEKRGLVSRQREQEDRRCTTISLTSSGRKLIGSVFPKHVAIVVKEMSALTQSEQESLRSICRKLGKAGAE